MRGTTSDTAHPSRQPLRMFVAPESIVLGSFSMLNGAFFVLVGTTYGYRDSHQEQDFQLRAYNPRNKVVLTTNRADAQGATWSYSASLQDGKNALRKQVFREAAGADFIVIPYPAADASPFISAVTRAIELRALAHSAGGEDTDEDEAGGEGDQP